MTLYSPRIYTYKITFEEVPYYYYGVHKEKKYNEYYMGSPVTYKWCWEFYTPKKQILEFFDHNEEGWLKAQEIEKNLIYPFYNTDKWCLNKNCGGKVSIETSRKNGKRLYQEKIGFHAYNEQEIIKVAKMGGQASYEKKVGVHARTKEQMSEDGKKAYQMGVGVHGLTKEEKIEIGKKCYEEGKGCFSLSREEKIEIGRKNGRKCYEEKKGCFSLTQEQRRENNKKLYEEKKGIHSLTTEERRIIAKRSSSQRWKCTVTGYVSNPCGLSSYQKKRCIDTSNRIRIK